MQSKDLICNMVCTIVGAGPNLQLIEHKHCTNKAHQHACFQATSVQQMCMQEAIMHAVEQASPYVHNKLLHQYHSKGGT